MVQTYETYGTTKKLNIPLLIFIPIIREALLQLGKYGLNVDTITVQDWKKIIEQTLCIKQIGSII